MISEHIYPQGGIAMKKFVTLRNKALYGIIFISFNYIIVPHFQQI